MAVEIICGYILPGPYVSHADSVFIFLNKVSHNITLIQMTVLTAPFFLHTLSKIDFSPSTLEHYSSK